MDAKNMKSNVRHLNEDADEKTNVSNFEEDFM